MHLLGKDGRGPDGHILQPLVDSFWEAGTRSISLTVAHPNLGSWQGCPRLWCKSHRTYDLSHNVSFEAASPTFPSHFLHTPG